MSVWWIPNKIESETTAYCARNAFNSNVTSCTSNVWLVHKLCQEVTGEERVLRNYPCGVCFLFFALMSSLKYTTYSLIRGDRHHLKSNSSQDKC